MLQPGSILENRYRIVRPLGQGGMGAVYEAVDQRFGTPVAVKEVLLELGADPDEAKRKMVRDAFEREAKALANARHEAVPFVRDYFSEDESEFLVMELVEGEELAELLSSRQAPFAVKEAVDWLDQLLDALDYLHTLSPPIVHRDIKPQNLKLNARGRVKLLDFGIAKSIDAGTATVTSHTFLAATLNYSPIEQIIRVIDPTFREFILLSHKEQGESVLAQSTDARCDIYALGATFYHLLTNHVPIDATKRAVEVWSGKPDPLKPPSEIDSTVPEDLSRFLMKAMAISRDDRFASASEMREALPSIEDLRSDQISPDAKTVAYPAANSGEVREIEQKERMRAETEVMPPAQVPGGPGETVAGPTITDEALHPTQQADTNAEHSVETSPAADTRGPRTASDAGGTEGPHFGAPPVKERNTAAAADSSGLGKWIFPAAGGAGILLGAVFIGAVWMAIPDPQPPDPFTDVNASPTNETDELTPSPSATFTPAETLSNRADRTPEGLSRAPSQAGKTPAPADIRTPRPQVDPSRSTRTPTPRPPTPTPTPKRMTDDCLYNGRCR